MVLYRNFKLKVKQAALLYLVNLPDHHAAGKVGDGVGFKRSLGQCCWKTVYELALNPAYFANHKLIEVFQTLVHEQCHIWQDVASKTSPRRSYHNREWADQMKAMGLQPSDTGRPGGKETGQRMSDYPMPGGLFEKATRAFVANHQALPWIDRIPATSSNCQPRESDPIGSIEILSTTLSELATKLVAFQPEEAKAGRNDKRRVHYQFVPKSNS